MSRRRSVARAFRLVAYVAACTAGGAARLDAQEVPRWRIAPSLGVLADAYDIGLDESRTGAYLRLDLSRALTTSVRGVASVGFARVNDVAAYSPSLGYTERNDWIFLSAGPQVDLSVGRMGVSLAVEAGVAWRRIVPVRGRLPEGHWPSSTDWSPYELIVPSLEVRLPLYSGVVATAGARVHRLGESGRLSPAYGLGLAFRR